MTIFTAVRVIHVFKQIVKIESGALGTFATKDELAPLWKSSPTLRAGPSLYCPS